MPASASADNTGARDRWEGAADTRDEEINARLPLRHRRFDAPPSGRLLPVGADPGASPGGLSANLRILPCGRHLAAGSSACREAPSPARNKGDHLTFPLTG